MEVKMKLSCTKEKLNKGINIVSRIVSPRGTLPVLNNILIKTDKGRLKISATDLEIGINTWVGAKVDSEGGITIPSRLIADFVSTNNDETINLELKDTTLALKSDKYEAHIKGIEASEFPLIPEVKKDSAVSVKSKNFKELINQVVFSAALDETRPILTGILLSIKDNVLKLVATDSYRLSEKKYILDKKISEELNVIIPQRTMHELARILTDSEENVDIKVGENQIHFSFGDTQLVSRLIEGSYIDYTQIIPKKYETRTEIMVSEFANAIKMASLFARESANNIKLKISKDKVDIIAVSPQVGDNVSKVDAKTEGKDLEIAFNAKFILDVLSVIKEEKINLEVIDKMSAGVIKPVKDKNYIYLIMPLRVEE
jgi:DNA polymerase-3 subunit beta